MGYVFFVISRNGGYLYDGSSLCLKMLDTTAQKEVQEMIDKAIDQHNKNATLISMAIGFTLMFFYADGLLRVVEMVK